jgi:putative Mg2+ transporter-C (MgtC) family protein
MSIPVTWTDIAVRLALTLLAGGLIGFNRGGHGRPAGLRTNLLVCLAASIAMILANLILEAPGGEHDPTLRMDVMRMPLGILSGMGFIGAGAILRRGDAVLGVTTAATLWFVTVVGLCFGAGLLGLGIAALGIGLVVLWGLKVAESCMKQERRATLLVRTAAAGIPDAEIRARLAAADLRIVSTARSYVGEAACTFTYEVRWNARDLEPTPPVVDELATLGGISELQWRPRG